MTLSPSCVTRKSSGLAECLADLATEALSDGSEWAIAFPGEEEVGVQRWVQRPEHKAASWARVDDMLEGE